MPVYEYVCRNCRRIVSVFQRGFTAQTTPVCSHCQSADLQRRYTPIRVLKGSRRQLDEVNRDRLLGHYEGRDKGSQASWARRVASELGEAGGEFREMAEKIEAGEEVFDLYDPAPTLEYKLDAQKEKLGGGLPESASGETA